MTEPRTPPRRLPEEPAPDPADVGTAFGMDLSIAGADAGKGEADEQDPLRWIRHWLERTPPK
ncbi:MAG: hypothetical protein U1E89_09720 [Burkholderiaceae bacterium]